MSTPPPRNQSDRTRRTDRGWRGALVPIIRAVYQDVWLFIVSIIVLLALMRGGDTAGQVARNQQSDTQALCSFRNDLQKRVDAGVEFLATHPGGIPGIPTATLRTSINGEQSTLISLRPLICPRSGIHLTSTGPPVGCHAAGSGLQVIPDPACTPGAYNPAVTQNTIHTTICVAGYTRRIRPSTRLTNALKTAQITAYGYRDTNPHDYEEDHFVPLELGGAAADPQNLWPEPGRSPNPKDRVENQLRAAVCAGRLTLAAAQREIVHDWRTVPPVPTIPPSPGP